MKSIKTKLFVDKFLTGILYLIIGLSVFFEHIMSEKSIVFFSVVLLLLLAFQILILPRMNFEPEDEMTVLHEKEAQALSFRVLFLVIAIINIIAVFTTGLNSKQHLAIDFKWQYMCIVLGMFEIMEYASFIHIERTGGYFE